MRIDAVTICGTDLHVLEGDVPEVADGRDSSHAYRRAGDAGIQLWSRNVSITTGLVDTHSTPDLIAMLNRGQLDASSIIAYRFGRDEMTKA